MAGPSKGLAKLIQAFKDVFKSARSQPESSPAHLAHEGGSSVA